LGRQENFSLFIPKHRKLAGRLIDIFMGVRSINDLQSVAAYSRDRVNPQLFNYALSVALLHRPDTKNLDIPLFAGLFPDKFVDSRVFERAREEATIVPEGSRRPVSLNTNHSRVYCS
jgi:tyrosinase